MTRVLSRRLSILTHMDMAGGSRSKLVPDHAPRQQMRRLSPVEEDAARRRCAGCFPFPSPRVHPCGDEWWVVRFDGLFRGLTADLRVLSDMPWELYKGRRGPMIRYELCQYAPGEDGLLRLARVTCVHSAGNNRERLMGMQRLALRTPPPMRRMLPARSDSGLSTRPRPPDEAAVLLGVCCEGLGPENLHAEMATHTFWDHTFDAESMRMRAIVTAMCFS